MSRVQAHVVQSRTNPQLYSIPYTGNTQGSRERPQSAGARSTFSSASLAWRVKGDGRPSSASRLGTTKGPHANGFDGFNGALQQLLTKVEGGTLQERWDRISEHLKTYNNDTNLDKAESISKSLYQSTINQTRNLPHPCAPRIAISVLLMEQFFYYLGRDRPSLATLLKSIQDEILQCIFISPPESNLKPFHTLDNDGATLEVMVANNIGETWVDKISRIERSISREEGENLKRGVEMAEELAYWREGYLRKVFTGWREAAGRERSVKREVEEAKRAVQSNVGRVAELEEQVQSLQQMCNSVNEIAAQLQQERNKVKSLTDQLEEFVRKEEVHKQQIEQVQILHRQLELVSLFQKEKFELEEEIRNLKNKVAQFNNLIFCFCQRLKIGRSDGEMREAGKELITDIHTIKDVDHVLSKWFHLLCNASVMRGGHVPNGVVIDYNVAHKMLTVYLYALHIMAPLHFSDIMFHSAIEQVAYEEKARIIIKVAEKAAVRLSVTEVDLLLNDAPHIHRVVLCEMFLRWCDPLLMAVGNLPMLTYDAAKPQFIGTKSTVQLTPVEWDKELEGEFQRVNQWTVLKHSVESTLNCLSIDLVRSSYNKTPVEGERNDLVEKWKQFTTIRRGRMLDIFPKDISQRAEIISRISDVLSDNVLTLKRVYKFYSNLDKETRNVMNEMNFWKFCIDSKISGKNGLSHNDVRDIFVESNRPTQISAETHDGDAPLIDLMDSVAVVDGGARRRRFSLYSSSDPTTATGTEHEMVPEEFVESVIRLAHKFYNTRSKRLDEALRLLLRDHISHALQVESDEFLKQVRSEEIQAISREYLSDLSVIFKRYSSSPKVGLPYQMNFDEFHKCMEDTAMFDSHFSHYAARGVFWHTQDEDDNSNLLFHEFIQALVAVAAYRSPSPFQTLSLKFRKFLELELLPNWKKR